MKASSGNRQPPLLVEWSASRVRVFDPVTRETTVGGSISECLNGGKSGREVVVAVGQRSTFIRTVPVPGASREEIEKIVAFKVAPLLPLSAGEYVSGFRLGRESRGGGRIAVIGAIRTNSLRRIHQEATQAGLNVRAVVPLAFGSWMAARANSLNDCAVVESRGDSIHIDLVADGELRYSRTVPVTTDGQTVEAEVAKTFAIAELPSSTVLSIASPGVMADCVDGREALEHLADPSAIDRYLFTLELPERTRERASRNVRAAMFRGLGTALGAVALAGYIAANRLRTEAAAAGQEEQHSALLSRGKSTLNAAQKRLEKLKSASTLLTQAFQPAQTLGDVIAVLESSSGKQAWLSGLSLERGKDMLVNGQALSSADVTAFVSALSSNPRFRDVKLSNVSKGLVGETPIVQFSISGHIAGNLPIGQNALVPPASGVTKK